MFDRMERGHEIERRAGEGRRADAGSCEPAPSRAARELKADRRDVESVRGAVAAEQLEIRARAAAAVEQARVGASGEGAPDERRDEPAEAAKPEMIRFGARRRAQEVVHVSS